MAWPGQTEPLGPKDVLLICSDGLWGQVRDPEILAAVENKSVEQAGRELIGLARQRGGPGKITGEILRLRWGGAAYPHTPPQRIPPTPQSTNIQQHPPPSVHSPP